MKVMESRIWQMVKCNRLPEAYIKMKDLFQ